MYLHLFSFKTPIFTELKKIQKCKINYDGLILSSSFLVIEEVKDEMGVLVFLSKIALVSLCLLKL